MNMTAIVLLMLKASIMLERVRHWTQGHIRGRDVPISSSRSPLSGLTIDECSDALDCAGLRRAV